MNHIGVPAFRLLLRVKSRRLAQLHQSVLAQAQVVQSQQTVLAQAQAASQHCQTREQACLEEIAQLGQGQGAFSPTQALTLRHLLQERQAESAQAEKTCRQCDAQLQQAQAQWLHLKHQHQQAQAQHQAMQERLAQMVHDQEKTQQDAQDSDTEETMAARPHASSAYAHSGGLKRPPGHPHVGSGLRRTNCIGATPHLSNQEARLPNF